MTALDSLVSEHRTIERMLSVFERWARAIRQGAQIDPDAVDRAIDFVRSFADAWHHGREEDLLFPKIEEAEPGTRDSVLQVMRTEHEEGRAAMGAAAEANAAVRAGDPEASGRLASTLLRFSGLLRDHIFKEDTVLFRMAEDLLSDEELEELAEAFRRCEDQLGPDTPHRYAAVVAELERIDPAA
jgi:hemerythrin-like domain-containing protein